MHEWRHRDNLSETPTNGRVPSGSTSGATCAPTGSTARASASQRRRPRSWRTLCATTASAARRERATRSCTASAGRRTTNRSKAPRARGAPSTPRNAKRLVSALNRAVFHSHPQILHRLRPLPELVPRALRGHPAERGHPHRRVRLPAVSVDGRRHDGPHATHRQGLRGVEKNITLVTGMEPVGQDVHYKSEKTTSEYLLEQ